MCAGHGAAQYGNSYSTSSGSSASTPSSSHTSASASWSSALTDDSDMVVDSDVAFTDKTKIGDEDVDMEPSKVQDEPVWPRACFRACDRCRGRKMKCTKNGDGRCEYAHSRDLDTDADTDCGVCAAHV